MACNFVKKLLESIMIYFLIFAAIFFCEKNDFFLISLYHVFLVKQIFNFLKLQILLGWIFYSFTIRIFDGINILFFRYVGVFLCKNLWTRNFELRKSRFNKIRRLIWKVLRMKWKDDLYRFNISFLKIIWTNNNTKF